MAARHGAGKSVPGREEDYRRHQKRRHKTREDYFAGALTKPSIRRLARRGGVKRISTVIYPEIREALRLGFLEPVMRDAVYYTEHAKRKTVTANDVILALKRHGRTLLTTTESYAVV